jgi:hypothetical protein
MKISIDQKKQIQTNIVDDLRRRQLQDKSYKQPQHAKYLDINVSIYNRVFNGELDKVLSDLEWVRIAKRLYVDINNIGWKTVNTAIYEYIYAQLEACQVDSLSAINADIVGIGKTHAAAQYAHTHPNVVYIKCYTGITRANFLRTLAMGMGIDSKGRVDLIREHIELHLTGLERPLIVLDDAGYMNDNCWMEVKGLYDRLEYECGWYIIGDTSLAKKIETFCRNDRLGWKALFDRFNLKFQSYTGGKPDSEIVLLKRRTLEQVLAVNMPGISKADAAEIISLSKLSLRVLRKEINKRLSNSKRLNYAA